MKRFLLLSVIVASCISSPQEKATVQDSSSGDGFEDFSEVAPFTIKDDIREIQLSIDGQRKKLREFLVKFYSPDTYTTKTQEDSVGAPKYIITEAKVIEGNFFAGEKKCESRSLLLTSRGDFIDQEFYDLLFLGREADGELTVKGKETFEGSQGQTSTIVTVENESLGANRNCVVLKVSSSSEGGDINLSKEEWVDYFIADASGFHSVLRLQLEDTKIQDYEVTQDENQNSSSETREVQVLPVASHGLHDLKVRYVSKQNGNTVADVEEIYKFDGDKYVQK